jgi:hypothetical protein
MSNLNNACPESILPNTSLDSLAPDCRPNFDAKKQNGYRGGGASRPSQAFAPVPNTIQNYALAAGVAQKLADSYAECWLNCSTPIVIASTKAEADALIAAGSPGITLVSVKLAQMVGLWVESAAAALVTVIATGA